ncbi:MAG TPA: hypothetical protein ENK54_08800 [Thiotrichales bacterium]|nr:hypothetical protein [Thiotrichales bacterium]
MAKKKTASIEELSAAELYELAKRREEEERRQQEEAKKEQLKELRAKRRALLAKHKKELAALDTEIARLVGRNAPRKKRGGRGSVTDAVIDIISKAGRITTTELKAALAEKGVTVGNLPQTLAYLKRQGRISSPARATYEITK